MVRRISGNELRDRLLARLASLTSEKESSMGQELQIPDTFKNKQMSSAFAAELNAHDDSLAEGIGQSYGVIGYKGKVWSLRVRGQRHNIIRPDDGTPSNFLDVIILDQLKFKSKSYYKKYEPGSSDGERPICSSINGRVPDADVTEKQSETCALCPRNVWKTDPQTGRKGRECTDYKRLAVLILPTQTKPILGEPLMEPAFLRVPPASLNSLAIMGEAMAAQGHHYSSYITRITFDPNKSWPEMVFRPLQGLTDAEAPVILPLRAHPMVARILGEDINGGLKAVTQALEAPGTHSTGLSVSAGSIAQATPSPSEESVQPAITSTLSTSPPVLGQSGQSFPPVSTPLPLAGRNTITGNGAVSDAGVPEESDAALDARIASLISSR